MTSCNLKLRSHRFKLTTPKPATFPYRLIAHTILASASTLFLSAFAAGVSIFP